MLGFQFLRGGQVGGDSVVSFPLYAAPTRLEHADVPVEKNLEDWIAHAPSLLEQGLVVVGRQIRVEGGPLDLFALHPQGRWVLIEITRERLRRDVADSPSVPGYPLAKSIHFSFGTIAIKSFSIFIASSLVDRTGE